MYLLVLSVLYSCSSSKLFDEYRLYHRDRTINYPKEILTLKFINDSTGIFINENNNQERERFNQTFTYSKVKSEYLIIKQLDQTNLYLISLKQGDTIVLDKNRLHFFYDGEKKYLLSFKKNWY